MMMESIGEKKESSGDKIVSSSKKYGKSKKGKVSKKNYWDTKKGKEARKKYSSSDKSKLTQRKYYYSDKGQEGVKRRAEARQQMRDIEKWLSENPGKTVDDYFKEQGDTRSEKPS